MEMPLNGFVRRSWVAIFCLSGRKRSCFSDFRSSCHWNTLYQVFLSLFTLTTKYRKDLTDFNFEAFHFSILSYTLRFTWLHTSAQISHTSVFSPPLSSWLILTLQQSRTADSTRILILENDGSMAQMLDIPLCCMASSFQMKQRTPAEWFLSE